MTFCASALAKLFTFSPFHPYTFLSRVSRWKQAVETFAALVLFADNNLQGGFRRAMTEPSFNVQRSTLKRQYEVVVIVQVRPVAPRAPLAVATARGRANDPVKLDAWCGRFRKTLERAIGEAEENVLEQLAAGAQQIGLFDSPDSSGFQLEPSA